MPELRVEVESLHEHYGYRSVRLIGREELRTLVPSERYTSALYDSNSGHLQPYKFTLGLAAAATRLGVKIFENSWVTKLELASAADADSLVHTASGTVRARHVLIAGNALLGRLVPELARKLMAVGHLYLGHRGARRGARTRTHHQQCGRGRHQLGARLFSPFGRSPPPVRWSRELFGHRSIRLRTSIARTHRARVPAARGYEHRIRLGRLRRHHAESRAAFRTPRANVYFLQGFSGHGMVLSVIAGKLVAEAMGATAARFDVFARIPHGDFPGGTYFRRPALVLAMLWFRLKDLV
jgi:gamma-glutamylputrescine oxidase